MNAIDSMLDIEQLRSSVNEQSIQTAIAQVHKWININGLALLKSNQRLPYDFKEAEEIRKFHEKIELKCMNFLAFYATMNLKTIPEECETMRQDMDIAIHNFSERVKARRHVVVSFYTFYRHFDELRRVLTSIKEDNRIHLPDTLPDVHEVIDKYHKETNMCLRRFAHLKDEVNRAKASLDTVLRFDEEMSFGSVDPVNIQKVKKHLDDLMYQIENETTSCYESQHLLEIEIKIEAKMMLIEDEIRRSTNWLNEIEQRIIDKYTANAVGKVTVENDILQAENEELVKKLEQTHEYGCRLKQMYKRLCEQFDRDTDRGEVAGSNFDELWALAEIISSESTDRLKIAGNLFHNLDTTLEVVEDLLLTINRDKQTMEKRDLMLQQYQSDISDVHAEFQNIKKLANKLFNKLHYNLLNKELFPSSPGFAEIEQTEDMVKMKIFTLSVKIKALERCIFNDETPIYTTAGSNEQSAPDIDDFSKEDVMGIIEKYLVFLNTSKLKWKSKELPKTIEQANKAIEAHKNLADQSNQYWNDVNNAVAEYVNNSRMKSEDREISALMTEAENRKRNWDKKWNDHLKSKLHPRLNFLMKIQKFSESLEEDLSAVDDLVTRPNHSLPLVKELRGDLERMIYDVTPKVERLNDLKAEAYRLHKSDFKNLISALEDKLSSYNDRLAQFLELEKRIQGIHEFLPQLSLFKTEWHSRVNMHKDNPVEMAELKEEAREIHAKIDKFDIDRLRKVAIAIYGSSKRIEWLIDELYVDFTIPKQKRKVENKIIPLQQEKTQMTNLGYADNKTDSRKKLQLVNVESDNPTKLEFEIESLPRLEKDQYDIQWYKNNEPINPDSDPRIIVKCEPRSNRMKMNIEHCEESDAGKYWCEVRSNTGVQKSSPVLLSVYSVKPNTVVPQFANRVLAAVNEPLTLKLTLNGFKYSPESELLFNQKPVNVNHISCYWMRTCSDKMVEFNHPSIAAKDQGQYEFRVSGIVVAKTEIITGEKPKFAYHDFSENAELGSFVKVAIPMENYANISPGNINWIKNDKPLSADKLNYKTYISNAGELVLEIPKFSKDHIGDYRCEVSNEFGVETLDLSLGINEVMPVKKSVPVTSSIGDKITANAGDSIILNLNFSPDPKTEVNWTKDGKLIDKSDPRIKILSNRDNSKSSLKINNVGVADSGNYKATIKDTGQNKITIVDIKSVSFAPVIQDYPQNIRVKQNGNLNMVCVVHSSPFVQSVNWTVQPADGSPLRNLMSNARYKIINKPFNNANSNMQRVELYFDNVTISDAGEYCMRVENPVGFSSVKIPVTVSVLDIEDSKLTSPKFVTPLKNEMCVETKETVSLQCKVVGNPPPKVKWKKNYKDLKESNQMKFISSGESHELLIANLRQSDSGLYEVLASNSQGSQSSQCQLKVIDSTDLVDSIFPPEATLSTSFVNKDHHSSGDMSDLDSPRRTQMIFSNSVIRSPPQFVTTFTDQMGSVGDDVLLKCCLIGNPEPIVWWSFNTHFLNNPRFEMSRELDEYHLLMRNVQKTDSGRYSITAENSSGLATCSALVIVNDDNSGSHSVDRSKYPTNSKSLPRENYSNALKPNKNDESRFLQASPLGYQGYTPRSSNSTPRLPDNDEPDTGPDVSSTKIKTTKTYHYSGPSGVDLPGIGFIPKINKSLHNSSSSSSSSKSVDVVAKFVAGTSKHIEPTPKSVSHLTEDSSRFSVVESSDCDFPY